MLKIHEIDNQIRGAYGLMVDDVTENGHPDIAVGSTGISMIALYEGPSFKKQVVSESHSGTIALAAHDLSGNGQRDLIVGGDFGRKQRIPQEYLHWLEAKGDGVWETHFIEWVPYLHRIALIDINGESLLFVATLQGAGSGFDEFESPGALWCYRLPEDPINGPWEKQCIANDLYLNHGLSACDVDGDGRLDILIGARGGLIWFEPPVENAFNSKWNRWTISTRECSETFAIDLDGDGISEILSIEPWHGNELVWYKATGDIRTGAWTRHLIDETLDRGHSLWSGDLDDDDHLEIVSGYNGGNTELRVYHPIDLAQNRWDMQVIDSGIGMGQMAVVDLNGDR